MLGSLNTLIVVRQHFQWLEFHIKFLGMAGKQCALSVQKAGRRSLFSETSAGMSTLTQWTPCCEMKTLFPIAEMLMPKLEEHASNLTFTFSIAL